MIGEVSSPPDPSRVPSVWAQILHRPARRAPWWAYLLPLLAAGFLARMMTSPAEGIVVIAGILALAGVCVLLRDPIRGLEFSLIIFPFYTFFRGVMSYLKIPAPLELLGMWTEVIQMLMLASFVIACIRQRTHLRLAWYDGPVLVMMASVLYGVVLTLSEHAWVAAMYGAHMSFFGMVFYLVTRWLPLTPAQVRRLMVLWLSSFALMAAISLVDYVVRFDFIVECAIAVRPDFARAFEPHQFFRWYPRMQSLMFAEQVFGTMCAFGAIYCLCRWSIKPRPRVLPPLLALMLVCLGLSMSRGALACFLASCFVLLLLRGSHRRIVTVCLAALAIAAAGIYFSGNTAAQVLVERTMSVTDTSNQLAYERVNQWQRAIQAFPLYPAGLGIGRAGASSMFHGTGTDTGVTVADGGVFKILAEQGLPGLLLFFLGAGLLFFTFVPMYLQLLQRAERGDAWAREGCVLGACVISLMAGLQVQNIGGNIFDSFFVQPAYWMLCGLFVRCYEYSTVHAVQKRRAELETRLRTLISGTTRRALPGTHA